VSPSTLPRGLPRAVVGSVAALVVLALGVVPAAAAGLTIELSPATVELHLSPLDNLTPSTEEGGGEFVPVEVEWGGAVDLRLPAGVDASAATYLLETGAETDAEPTRTLSSQVPGAGHLDVAGQAGGAVRISLPTDGSSGPLALLTVAGLTGTVPGIDAGEDLSYLLESTGSGTSVVTLTPALYSYAGLPCSYAWSAEEPAPGVDTGPGPDCSPYPVTAGTTVGLTLPPDSLLRTVGVDSLSDVTAVLVPVEPETEPETDDGFWTGFDDGFDDGRAAGLLAGPEAEHVPAHGPSFDTLQAADRPDYEAGYEDGHAAGWDDATHVAPDDDGDDGDDGGEDAPSNWSLLVGWLGEERASLGEARAPVEPAPGGPAPTVAASRVAAAARAVGDASAAGGGPTGLALPDEVDEEVSVGGDPYDDWVLPVTLTAAGVEVTVPAGSSTGENVLLLALDVGPTGPSSSLYLALDVTAAPAAVAPVAALPGPPAVAPALNPGLASNTGWTEPAAGRSVPLVALGGTALLAAGLGAAVVLRPRRRPVTAVRD
jgi:hypothetical protein